MAPMAPKAKDGVTLQTVLAGDPAAIDQMTEQDPEKDLGITHTGMTVEAFQTIVQDWIAKAKHQRFERPYTELVYQPMLEVMQYLRASGYKTYFVTGGGRISYPRTQRRSTASRPSRSWGRPPTRSSGMTRTGRPL